MSPPRLGPVSRAARDARASRVGKPATRGCAMPSRLPTLRALGVVNSQSRRRGVGQACTLAAGLAGGGRGHPIASRATPRPPRAPQSVALFSCECGGAGRGRAERAKTMPSDISIARGKGARSAALGGTATYSAVPRPRGVHCRQQSIHASSPIFVYLPCPAPLHLSTARPRPAEAPLRTQRPTGLNLACPALRSALLCSAPPGSEVFTVTRSPPTIRQARPRPPSTVGRRLRGASLFIFTIFFPSNNPAAMTSARPACTSRSVGAPPLLPCLFDRGGAGRGISGGGEPGRANAARRAWNRAVAGPGGAGPPTLALIQRPRSAASLLDPRQRERPLAPGGRHLVVALPISFLHSLTPLTAP